MAKTPRAANRNSDASPEEKFLYAIINDWKTKAKPRRAYYERLAQVYRTHFYPREDQPYAGASFDAEQLVESNYFFAFADTLVAQVVPPNPEVTIRANKKELDDPARFREALVNRLFKKEDLAAKLWKLCTRASVWPHAFIKTVWSESRKRPIFRVVDPQHIFWDMSAEDFEDIRYICEVTVLTKAEFKRRLKKKGKAGGFYRSDAEDEIEFGEYPSWINPDPEGEAGPMSPEEMDVDRVRASYEWTVVYEFYDLRSKKFYQFADGVEKPLMVTSLPYKHLSNPYGLLVFNDNLSDLGGISDAELTFPTLERLNEMVSLEMWHCKTSIPVPVIHEGLVDDPEAFADAYESVDGPGQIISVEARPQVGINQVVSHTPVASLPIEWGRSSDKLERLIEFILGMPSYQRGELGQSDVATELALTDTATRTRNARRQKSVYKIISWCAKAVVALYQEFLPVEESLPLRLAVEGTEAMLTRELLAFGERTEDPWSFDYEALPYNAAEMNSVVQLKQMEVMMPILMQGVQAGYVGMGPLMKKLLENMDMPELYQEPPPQPAAPPGGMDPMAAMAAMAGGGAEGMMPASMPEEMQPLVQGGEVTAGAGAQAVPGGLEGGSLPGPLGGLAG
jgi:hypothetical protein